MAANSLFNIVGNITRDPEIRLTTKQTKYCFVTVAVNKKDATDFIPVLLWEKLAENMAKYCKKGDAISISGYVTTIKRDDKTNIQLTADSFTIIHSRKDKPSEAPTTEKPNPIEDKFENINENPDPFAPF